MRHASNFPMTRDVGPLPVNLGGAGAPVVPMLLSIPYEEGTYWRKGAKHGPPAIREQMDKLRPISMSTGTRLSWTSEQLYGAILDLDPYNRELAFQLIHAAIGETLAAGRAPISLGGDHSITIPILRALSELYGPGGFGVIHIDAHSDTFPAINGYNLHHGAVFRVAVEERLIRANDIVQLGLRGTVRDGGLDFVKEHGIRFATMEQWRRASFSLAPFVPCQHRRFYLSFDIDVVDPAYAPATGTPVPGGLTSSEALDVIRSLSDYPLVGADLVEVAPLYDTAGITSLLASHIIFEILTCCRFVVPQTNAAAAGAEARPC